MNTSTPEAGSFLQFWIVIGFIAVIGVNVLNFFTLLSNRKQKREVNFAFEPASKEEFDSFTATTNANFVQCRDEMKRDRENNQIHASERQKTLFKELKDTRERLEDQLADVGKKVAGLETASGINTQITAGLSAKLDRIIENKLT
jgi:ABC-type protease/lipase transport system fused ATPase/permease subunit